MATQRGLRSAALPPRAGIGLKPCHAAEIEAARPDIGFVEVHAENYMGAGGPPLAWLDRLRERYALSIHGVGLSIGGESPLDERHLDRLVRLVERFEPASFSEHLAWSTHGGMFLNDLLPVPYDTSTLRRVVAHVDLLQERLRRRILLENPSTYVAFAASTWDEPDFLAEIARRTGCGLLLDVNNVMVSAVNHGRDAEAYIESFALSAVEEFHLAGHAEDRDSLGERLLIDAHDRPVCPGVWALFRHAVALAGPRPTLIEWDNAVPPLATLLAEAGKAERETTVALAEVENAHVAG